MKEILQASKKYGGPFTSVEDMESVLKQVNEEKEKTFRNKLFILKDKWTNKITKLILIFTRLIIQLSQIESKFGILLSGSYEQKENIELPEETSILQVLDDPCNTVKKEYATGQSVDEIPLNEPCAVIWDNASGQKWVLGMTWEKIGHDEYLVDYLKPDPKDASRKHWRCPTKPDEQPTKLMQIISLNVTGSWNLTTRKSMFVLDNHVIINGLFQEFYQKIT